MSQPGTRACPSSTSTGLENYSSKLPATISGPHQHGTRNPSSLRPTANTNESVLQRKRKSPTAKKNPSYGENEPVQRRKRIRPTAKTNPFSVKLCTSSYCYLPHLLCVVGVILFTFRCQRRVVNIVGMMSSVWRCQCGVVSSV